MSTTRAPAARSRARASSYSATASSDGLARSYTSPATSTASTRSARTVSTRWPMNAACASRRSARCSDRPRCQSEVCRNRMTRTLAKPPDIRTGIAVLVWLLASDVSYLWEEEDEQREEDDEGSACGQDSRCAEGGRQWPCDRYADWSQRVIAERVVGRDAGEFFWRYFLLQDSSPADAEHFQARAGEEGSRQV